jgi:nucleoside-diphosphate-sugar epimerase
MRAAGFDPICALVSDKDVARAVQAAVKSPTSGIFNIAGHEAVPLSTLARWTGHSTLPVPSPLLSLLAAAERTLGLHSREGNAAGPHLRFGFTLDTRRAEAELGFHSHYRIGMARAGDGTLRLEAASV